MTQDSARLDTQWPPKSPRDAWLSSPTRQKRHRSALMERTDTSPSASPLRRALFIGKSTRSDAMGRDGNQSPRKVGGEREGEDVGEEDDDDEETLELKLKAIETRLKLKRLRQAKDSPAAAGFRAGGVGGESRAIDRSADGIMSTERDVRGLSRSEMQVPLSPTKKIDLSARQNGIEGVTRQTSPMRSGSHTLLSARKIEPAERALRYQNPPMPVAGSSLCSSIATNGSGRSDASSTPAKSFNERIAEGRQSAKEKLERDSRLARNRSRGFHAPVRSGECRSESLASGTSSHTTRPQFLQAGNGSSISSLSSSSSRRTRSPSKQPPLQQKSTSTRIEHHGITQRNAKADELSTTKQPPPHQNEDESSTFEPYSGFHLSRRHCDHDTLTRLLEHKDLYSIPKLLKIVKSPDFEPPDSENDYVVFGVVAWKSTPYDHKGNQQQQQQKKSKFMVIKLTDLKWELDLFLFDTGFDQFWKMSLGTVVAILNPGIFPPKNADTGRFSLKLSSSEDTVVEIGSARDLGFCKSVKKDGQECCAWIDRRRTEFCDFHVALQLEKAKAGRMEVNGSATFAGTGGGSGSNGNKHRFKKKSHDDEGGGLLKEGRQHDRQLHESYYLAPSQFGLVKSASALMDGDDEPGVANTERGRSKRELNRKRVLEKSKERDLARKLGDIGNGMGSEYLRSRHANSQETKENLNSSQNLSDVSDAKVDAESLGLVKSRLSETQLCTAKRRRLDARSEPVGWSSAFKSGLSRVTNSKEEKGPMSPSKKKARFILEKGIREPGRESLGKAISGNAGINDDDLEII